jgi:hypothetical protein
MEAKNIKYTASENRLTHRIHFLWGYNEILV